MNTSIATIAPEARVAKLSELQAKIATRLQARALVLTEEVMQNMPEYACMPWIDCTDYDYENKQYTFKVASLDGEGEVGENDPEVTVTVDELSKTMPLFYLAVQACMLIAFHHGPDRIEISSDGDGEEWLAAVDLVKSIGVDVFNPELAARLVATKQNSLVRELAALCLKQDGK